jgi:uncharacterized membrane protein
MPSSAAKEVKPPPKPQAEPHDEGIVSFERLISFSDGVYAFAITLLAIDIRLPPVALGALPQALLALLPEIGVYALSFVIVGLYWVSHQRMFQYIVRYDYTLVWLNLLHLLCIAFLPAAYSILANNLAQPVAVLFYCTVLCITSLSSIVLWWYAGHNHRLVESDLEPQIIRYLAYRADATIVVALLAAGLAFLSTTAAWLLLVSYAALAILSGRVSGSRIR